MKRFTIFSIIFTIALLIVQNKCYSQKTDTIVHINGNVLTGDLKKLVYGVDT
ncbi:MAG: hypothetical protein R2764_04010 [Bacteroidales bacterium]